ncbi:MAG: 4-(cytidine 5'-diphospho)-2-C-methyl-D-erythritol kinase [Sphingomonadaceae bacterium]
MSRPRPTAAGWSDGEPAPAKLNLALHVRARRPDGYHDIETLFAFADHGDLLLGAADARLRLEIAGPFAIPLAPESDNLVLSAGRALRERLGIEAGARLRLEKRLPVAAGLGGGSADAAAALRLLARMWRIDPDDPALGEIATGLGADVPACLRSRPAIGGGRGDRLEPLEGWGLEDTPLLIVNPGKPLATAEVFAAWDGDVGGPMPADSLAGRNDLEVAASRLMPEIGEVLAALRGIEGARHARMSGSGPSCFALFDDEAARDRAARKLAAAHPGWWICATRLR